MAIKKSNVSLTDRGVAPGFYQGPTSERLRGRASGRVAPRDHVREPAWEETLKAHDLMPRHAAQVGSNAGFDANQGQLFDTQAVAPRSPRTPSSVARDYGAPTGDISVGSKGATTGLAAQPGFMPTLSRKQKVSALENTAAGRIESGAWQGGGHFAEMMSSRQAHHDAGRNQPWYMGVDSSGKHQRGIQGDAPRLVQESAARVGNTSAGQTRAVATMSPQMAWKSEGGSRGETTAGRYPNIEAAEGVVRATRSHLVSNPDATPDALADVGRGNAGMGLQDMAAKTATGFAAQQTAQGRSTPFNIRQVTSQKSPNFEASLNLSHIDPKVQQIAAQSYTVDRHDAAAVGIDRDTGLGRRGVYEAVAMTGRRSALKNRELPPNEQARQWESVRSQKGLGSGAQMFRGGEGGSAIVPHPNALPSTPSSPKAPTGGVSRSKQRSASAQANYSADLDAFGS